MIHSVERFRGEAPDPRTLAQLHLDAERSGRSRVTLRWRDDGRWHEMPAWRFYRQVIRVGLFLRERLGIRAGDHVLIASPLRVERVLAEWATVMVGAVALAVDPDLPDIRLASQCATRAPNAAFAGGAEWARLSEVPGVPVAEKVVVLDSGTRVESTRSWTEALDLGGTLETAERAQSFRSQAQAVAADMPALGHWQRSNGRSVTFMTHGELVRRLRAFWAHIPARDGDRAYVPGGSPSLQSCLAVWGFVADGRTTTILGTPGREVDEIAELRPHLYLAPPELRGNGVLLPVRRSRPLGLFERVPALGRFTGQPVRRGIDGPQERSHTARAWLAETERGLRAQVSRLFRNDATPGDALCEILAFDEMRVQAKKWRFQ